MSNCQTLGTNDYYEAFIRPYCELPIQDYMVQASGYMNAKKYKNIGYLFIPRNVNKWNT